MVSRVTVLMPLDGASVDVRRAVASVQSQTLRDWELVLGVIGLDDELSLDFEPDARVRVVARRGKAGPVANLNLLLAGPTGSYVAIMDPADWWEPAFLETLVSMLEAAPESLMATCAARMHGEHGQDSVEGLAGMGAAQRRSTCRAPQAARLLANRNALVRSSVLARKALYDRFRRFEPTLALAGDWLMWLRAGATGGIEVTDSVLTNHPIHELTADEHRMWAMDLLRLGKLLEAEWSDPGAPFPGAADAILRGVGRDLRQRSAQMRATDAELAVLLRRLADAINAGGARRIFLERAA